MSPIRPRCCWVPVAAQRPIRRSLLAAHGGGRGQVRTERPRASPHGTTAHESTRIGILVGCVRQIATSARGPGATSRRFGFRGAHRAALGTSKMRIALLVAALVLASCDTNEPLCNPKSCSDGCCDAEGRCIVEQTPESHQCGRGGAACMECSFDEKCDVDQGICVPKCSRETCNGCCHEGTCLWSYCEGADGQCYGCSEGFCSNGPITTGPCGDPTQGVYCCAQQACVSAGQPCTGELPCCGYAICAGTGTVGHCYQRCLTGADCPSGCCQQLSNSNARICRDASICSGT